MEALSTDRLEPRLSIRRCLATEGRLGKPLQADLVLQMPRRYLKLKLPGTQETHLTRL